MCEFYKIKSPNAKSIVVASKNGWWGLTGVCDKISEQNNSLIEPISLWKFIKYIIGLGD